MKRQWMKWAAVIMVIALSVTLLAACDKKEDEGEKKTKVGLILEGAISDMSWNATAYEGLKKIEAMGADISYLENVPIASAQEAIRTFAEDGFDIIFISSNSYQDVTLSVAETYPEVQFLMINSAVTEANIRSFTIEDAEQGFLMGALAALLTENGKVGFIGGLPIHPIIQAGEGFEQGVAYIDPSIEVLI